jgi:hypothetical protein
LELDKIHQMKRCPESFVRSLDSASRAVLYSFVLAVCISEQFVILIRGRGAVTEKTVVRALIQFYPLFLLHSVLVGTPSIK